MFYVLIYEYLNSMSRFVSKYSFIKVPFKYIKLCFGNYINILNDFFSWSGGSMLYLEDVC